MYDLSCFVMHVSICMYNTSSFCACFKIDLLVATRNWRGLFLGNLERDLKQATLFKLCGRIAVNYLSASCFSIINETSACQLNQVNTLFVLRSSFICFLSER